MPGAPPSGSERGRRSAFRLVLAVVAIGATAVVLSTAWEGPAHVVLRTGPPVTPVARNASPPTGTAFAPVSGANSHAADAVVGTVLAVIAALLALALVVVLIRLLLGVLRDRPRRRPDPVGIGSAGIGTPLQTVDAPAVRRGIAAALDALADLREPTDAVVRAWLGLQQSAEDAGLARSPSETPTEFTERVLVRSSADRDALRTLLALYLRARFDDDRVTAAEAATAVTALRALEASWAVPAEAAR
jgi:Domain of unknown function (DUF4129)